MTHDLRKSSQPRPILCGWKEIANYLGVGVRTVQRYEIELQLPVRRASRRRRGLVMAATDELDAWVHEMPFRGSR